MTTVMLDALKVPLARVMAPVPAFRLLAVTEVKALRNWSLLLADVLVVRFVAFN